MIRTVEAEIDEHGNVHLLEAVELPSIRRAIVTILDEKAVHTHETALLAEPALANDWLKPEEDAAWSHLQPVR